MLAETFLQEVKRVTPAGKPPSRIDLLKGNDVGRPTANESNNPVQVEPRIVTERAVNIPSHDTAGLRSSIHV
jgi:hypothetical protein